jgi:hypothetical protein
LGLVAILDTRRELGGEIFLRFFDLGIAWKFVPTQGRGLCFSGIIYQQIRKIGPS